MKNKQVIYNSNNMTTVCHPRIEKIIDNVIDLLFKDVEETEMAENAIKVAKIIDLSNHLFDDNYNMDKMEDLSHITYVLDVALYICDKFKLNEYCSESLHEYYKAICMCANILYKNGDNIIDFVLIDNTDNSFAITNYPSFKSKQKIPTKKYYPDVPFIIMFNDCGDEHYYKLNPETDKNYKGFTELVY